MISVYPPVRFYLLSKPLQDIQVSALCFLRQVFLITRGMALAGAGAMNAKYRVQMKERRKQSTSRAGV
ncbi:MAG: hypothetical protein C9356_08125 [Oleiphilus sp.]|nr:MAG: hypothetical protein C9356_08125 [Oleiphilus sp.]